MPKKKGKYYESLKFVIPYHTRSTLTRDLYLIIEASIETFPRYLSD